MLYEQGVRVPVRGQALDAEDGADVPEGLLYRAVGGR